MKKVLILGIALIFSGSILASTFESPPAVDENPIVIVATDYNDFTESFIVDSVIVNPNITADIVIAIKEAYVDDFVIDNQKPLDSFNYNESLIATNDYNVIRLNDDNLEPEKIFHEDPGNNIEASLNTWNPEINYPSESPPKLE